MKAEEFPHLYKLEESYWWFVGMRAVTASLLEQAAPDLGRGRPHEAIRALDVGCGTGIMLDWLERFTAGTHVTGLEYSRAGLLFCRDRGHRLLVQGSAIELPFPDASFDLVTSFEVLDELPDDHPAFDEMARILRPGGWLLLRLPAMEWLRSRHDSAMHTQRRTTLEDLREKVEARGLAVERQTYANTFLLPLVAAVRVARRFLPGEDNQGSDVRQFPPGLRWLDRFFLSCLLAEARLLRRPGASLPFGVSAICLARKK